MTPSDKADKLIHLFRPYIPACRVCTHECESLCEEKTKSSTQCAIICVEEIITGLNNVVTRLSPYSSVSKQAQQSFWNEVLSHLKNKK